MIKFCFDKIKGTEFEKHIHFRPNREVVKSMISIVEKSGGRVDKNDCVWFLGNE